MVITLEGEALEAYADVTILRRMVQAIQRAKERALLKCDDERYARLCACFDAHYEFCEERGIDFAQMLTEEDCFEEYMATKERLGIV